MTDPRFELLAVAQRSGVDECWYHGAVVGLAADGSTAFSVGDPNVEIYPRSCNKSIRK